MRRVLAFFTSEYWHSLSFVGGAERRFASIARHLPAESVEFVVLAFKEDQIPLSVGNGKIFVLPRKDRYRLLRLCIDGIRVVRKSRCDGVYAYQSDSLQVIVPSLIVSILTLKPLFVVVHDDWKRSEDSADLIGLLKTEMNPRRGKKRLLKNLVHLMPLQMGARRVAIRLRGTCICVSEFALQYAREVMKAKRVRLGGNAVDQQWFHVTSNQKSYDAVFVGRFERAKGVFTLLHAWRQVVEQRPDARLLLIGKVQDQVWSLAKKLGIESNVTLKSVVEKDSDLRNLLGESKLFVLPSEREGFGLAALEAMAAGLPCVLTDIPAFVENFKDGAKLVRVGDPAALAQAILSLLQDPVEARSLSLKGRELAGKFTWEKASEREATIMIENLPAI